MSYKNNTNLFMFYYDISLLENFQIYKIHFYLYINSGIVYYFNLTSRMFL